MARYDEAYSSSAWTLCRRHLRGAIRMAKKPAIRASSIPVGDAPVIGARPTVVL